MTTQSIAAGGGFEPAKMLTWTGGCIFTALFLDSIGVTLPLSAVGAIVVQLALSNAQKHVWRGQFTLLGVVALVVDTLINFAALWTRTERLATSNVYVQLRDALP